MTEIKKKLTLKDCAINPSPEELERQLDESNSKLMEFAKVESERRATQERVDWNAHFARERSMQIERDLARDLAYEQQLDELSKSGLASAIAIADAIMEEFPNYTVSVTSHTQRIK